MLDEQVAAAFDLDLAFASQLDAFRALAAGQAELSPRLFLDGDGTVPTVFAYGARASMQGPACVRVACVGGIENHRRGLPELDAIIVLTDAETGLVRAVLEGVAFTLIRTAAAAAVAAEHLALREARHLALFGSGPQADACAQAISRVRDLASVAVWSPTAAHRAAAAQRIQTAVGVDTRQASSPTDALRTADIVVAVTNSHTPVFPGREVEPGALVISMGSFRPDRCEVDDELLDRTTLVVADHPPVALATAGPVIRWAKRCGDAHIVAIGELISGGPVRRGEEEIVFFNSVGLGVQDAAAAVALLAVIEERSIGLTLGSLRSHLEA